MTAIANTKNQLIGLPQINAGMFVGAGAGTSIQIFFKFATCTSFNIQDITDFDEAGVITVDRSTANAYVVKGTETSEVYSWIATGHG
jgi:hypothetical protein